MRNINVTDQSLIRHEKDLVKIAAKDKALYRDESLAALTVYSLLWLHQWQLRRTIEAALERAVAETDQRALARRLKAGRTVYQHDPAGSGVLERIDAGGKRTLGRLVNRQFVPARPTRSRAR